MADPYMGEIRMFAGNYPPVNWAFCDGQVLAISQFQALYAVMGTTYGGDGRSTFGIPNLKDRVPMGRGNGPGLTPRMAGDGGGSFFVTLTNSQMPSHNHDIHVTEDEADEKSPQGAALAKGLGRKIGTLSIPQNLYNEKTRDHIMSEQAVQVTGGSQGHINVQPYLGINFILCMVGIFPPRN